MTNDGSKKRRNRILNLLKVAISLVGVAVLLRTLHLGEVARVLQEANWLPFVAALLLFQGGAVLRAYRWASLVWALGMKARWWHLVRLYFVGAFFNLFLPTGMGGDAVKMYELAQDEGQAAASISSVLMDRFLGFFILFAQALLALAISGRLVSLQVRILVGIVLAVCVVGIVLVLQRTWIAALGKRLRVDKLLGRVKILRELYESLYLYSTAALLRATAASVAWNLILILANYLLGLAVGIYISPIYYFLLIPVISALLLFPSVGGLGVREAGYVALFSQVPGVTSAQAAALAVAFDLTLLCTALIGAASYVWQGVREARR
jgi:glycosyltransferase 2 family protein